MSEIYTIIKKTAQDDIITITDWGFIIYLFSIRYFRVIILMIFFIMFFDGYNQIQMTVSRFAINHPKLPSFPIILELPPALPL